MRALRSERGVALLIVLWVVAFISVVVSAFAFSMRTEVDAARGLKEEAQAYFLAQAAIARGVAELARPELIKDKRNPLYDSGEVGLGPGAYQVVLTDEESKIPLNQADADVLRRLLQSTGVQDQGVLDTVVDSILDWRDPDNLRRPSGAEEEYYRSLPRPYHPKNGEFDSLEELLLVKGMTPEILNGNIDDPERQAALREERPHERQFRPGEYLGIRQFLTVQGYGRVNIGTAEPEVLAALGLAPEEIEQILQGGGQQVARVRRRQLARTGLRLVVGSETFRLEAQGRLAGSPLEYHINAVVGFETFAGQRAPRVLDWSERLK